MVEEVVSDVQPQVVEEVSEPVPEIVDVQSVACSIRGAVSFGSNVSYG